MDQQRGQLMIQGTAGILGLAGRLRQGNHHVA
jgi:hypothetical protein